MTMPPLGLWYLAAQLEALGHETDFRALDCDDLPADGEFDQVWLSATSPQMYEVRRIATEVRGWQRTRTVFGGAAPWARPESAQGLGFDLVVAGEADHPTTVEIILEELSKTDPKHSQVYRPPITPGPLNWALPPVRRWDDRYHFTLTGRDGTRHRTATLFTSRGCPMACAFCIAEGQRVLMADWSYKPIEEVQVGERVMALHHGKDKGRNQAYIASTIVTDTSYSGIRETVAVTAGNMALICTPDHKLYVDDGHKTRWKRADSSIPGTTRVRTFWPLEEFSDDYKRGWCAGYIAGDGCTHKRNGQTNITVASRDPELLDRLTDWSVEFGCTFRRFEHNFGPGAFPTKYEGTSIDAVQCTSGPESDEYLERIQSGNSTDYGLGWLAGMFDADGQLDSSGPQCRIHQSHAVKPHNTRLIDKHLTDCGFSYDIQQRESGMSIYCIPAADFLTRCRPLLERKYLGHYGYKGLPKRSITRFECNYARPVYDITTEAHSFIVEGFIVHNCESGRNGVIWDRVVRYEPVELVEQQLREISERGHTGAMFYDDIMPLNKDRTLALLAILPKYVRAWRGFVRTDVIIKQGGFDYLRAMAESGLVEVLAGVESADNRIKANIHKGTTIEQDTQVLGWCKQLGIKFKASFILGLPGEDRDSLERTREWILTQRPDRADVNTLIPMPGTPITRASDFNGNGYDVQWGEELPEEWFYKGKGRSASVLVSTSHLSSDEIAEFRRILIAEIEQAGIPF